MGKLPIYLISALVVLCMAFLLFRSFIFPPTDESGGGTTGVNYTSPSGLWSAKFLADPKYTTNVFRDDIGLPTVTVEGATLDQGAELYVIRLFHYHTEEKKDLLEFADEIVQTWSKKFPSLKLIRQDQIVFKSHPALSFTLIGNNLEMLGVVFGEEDYMYLIAWVGNMNNKELEKVGEDHFQTFLNSFELTP